MVSQYSLWVEQKYHKTMLLIYCSLFSIFFFPWSIINWRILPLGQLSCFFGNLIGWGTSLETEPFAVTSRKQNLTIFTFRNHACISLGENAICKAENQVHNLLFGNILCREKLMVSVGVQLVLYWLHALMMHLSRWSVAIYFLLFHYFFSMTFHTSADFVYFFLEPLDLLLIMRSLRITSKCSYMIVAHNYRSGQSEPPYIPNKLEEVYHLLLPLILPFFSFGGGE